VVLDSFLVGKGERRAGVGEVIDAYSRRFGEFDGGVEDVGEGGGVEGGGEDGLYLVDGGCHSI